VLTKRTRGKNEKVSAVFSGSHVKTVKAGGEDSNNMKLKNHLREWTARKENSVGISSPDGGGIKHLRTKLKKNAMIQRPKRE